MGPSFGLTLANRGVVLGAISPDDLLDLTQRAEKSGQFASVWAGDSLFAKPRLDMLTLFAAVAGRTSRLRFGPACMASFPLRDPVVFAYEWASLDRIADGRATLIVCGGGGSAGDWEAEARAFGIPTRERHRRLEENIDILRRLWSEDDVTYQGTFRSFSGVTLEPKPVQDPCPIWIANNPHTVSADPSRLQRALRRVARISDGWMTHSVTPEEFSRRWQIVLGLAEQEGRDPSGLGNCLYHNINVNEDREAAFAETKAFLDEYYSTNYTRERVEAWSALGSPEQCIENLRSFRDSGVQETTLRLCSWNQLPQFKRVVEEVLPYVND